MNTRKFKSILLDVIQYLRIQTKILQNQDCTKKIKYLHECDVHIGESTVSNISIIDAQILR